MSIATPARRNVLRAALLLVAALFAVQLQAQSLRVTVANGTPPSAVYDTLFSPPSTTLLNADGASYQSLQSLVFVPGSNAGVDLIAADTVGGKLVHYYAPTGTPLTSATVIWSAASQVPGPQQPDGLSVDAAGNLYVTTNYPCPQLWVLQPSTTAPGGYGPPALLDAHFAGREVDALVDSVVVPSNLSAPVLTALAANGVHPGDVLVLVADTDHDPYDPREGVTVFGYSAASIAAHLANPGSPLAPPATALRESQFLQSSHRGSSLPTGLDIWPIDGSLILSASNGEILQYTLPVSTVTANYSSSSAPPLWTQASRTTFAAIPCGDQGRFFKMRTGIQSGTAYVFVTQVTGLATGNILQFAVPAEMATPPDGFGFVNATLTVPTSAYGAGPSTAGPPVGIAVAPPAVVTPAADCVAAGGCNPTGGLSHTILPGAAGVGPQGVRGNIVEQTCIVTDSRVQADGSCPGTLNIATLCPGFPANIVPTTICGASGPSKNQLAIVQSIANGVDDVPGIVVQSESSPAELIPGTTDLGCSKPSQVVGWTPRLGSDEGVTPEGAAVIDMTTYCDRSGGTTRGNSIWVLGGQLSTRLAGTAALTGYTNQKLVNLSNVIQSGNIARPVKTGLDVCLIATAVLLNTRHYACATRALYDCDQFVANNAASFGSSPDNPNPYGDVRGRLGSIFYTINSRIQSNPANPIWPLTSAPPACR